MPPFNYWLKAVNRLVLFAKKVFLALSSYLLYSVRSEIWTTVWPTSRLLIWTSRSSAGMPSNFPLSASVATPGNTVTSCLPGSLFGRASTGRLGSSSDERLTWQRGLVTTVRSETSHTYSLGGRKCSPFLHQPMFCFDATFVVRPSSRIRPGIAASAGRICLSGKGARS